MAPRPVPLGNLKQGINRLRVKGMAAATQLYDLVNAYVTVGGSISPREGTIINATLDGSTKGLMADDGVLNIFGNYLAGQQQWNLTPATSGSKSGYANNGNGGVFGQLSPEGASLAGYLLCGFYVTLTSFVVQLTGDAVTANFQTAWLSNVWVFGYNNGTWSQTGTHTSTSQTVSYDPVNNVTTFTWLFTSGQAPTVSTATYFGAAPATVPAGYTFSSLIDPNFPYEPIQKIWFAKPFMGFPYVVAQFDNGDIFHYWLQNSGEWTANTVYKNTDYILPATTQTGLAYIANRTNQPNTTWESNVVIPPVLANHAPALLLHFDGANGGITFVDSSVYAHTMTTYGTAQTSTTAPEFGSANYINQGATTFAATACTITTGSLLDFAVHQTWTVECWIKLSGGTGSIQNIWSMPQGTGGIVNGIHCYSNGGTLFVQNLFDGNTADSASGISSTSTWHHVAVVSNVGYLQVFLDGVGGLQSSVPSTFATDAYFVVGNGYTGSANNAFLGQIDELRVTPDAALYTTNFTPPTAAFTNGQSLIGYTVEPTEYNGFMYRVVAVAGSNPSTSGTEPTWPTSAGATVQEFGQFDTNTDNTGSINTTSSALSGAITDRYGDSATIASGGEAETSSITLPSVASTQVTVWTAGTVYAPGSVVKPTTGQGAFVNAIPNGDFENGNDGSWALQALWSYSNGTGQYQGNWCLAFASGSTMGGGNYARMTNHATVSPGQSVTLTGYLNPNNAGANLELWLALDWYDSTDTLISENLSAPQEGVGYKLTTLTAVAPARAVGVRAAVRAGSGTTSRNIGYADLLTWSLETPSTVSNYLYEAVQASNGVSAGTEPTWPTSAGSTVTDNTVTWEAVGTSIITWEAIPIMQSGSSEPTWPTVIGNTVLDPSTFNTLDSASVVTSISWQAASRQITDTNCPNTNVVALAASHVFAGDKDITGYSAAVNPTDWTTANNAGYLPTGLNNYGDNPVAVLALYRSNLVVLNAGGYQMWQVDPDPQNMALLDAQPVGSVWPQAAQSVANDLLFLTEVGVRNLATAGANANMAIGATGQPIDPLVKDQLDAGTYYPISLYYPGRGQYWLIFGPQAFVLTVNGSNQKTWSRYIFPDTITDSTLNDGNLYIRTLGNLVLELTDEALQDEMPNVNTTGVNFYSWVQWPYLSLGSFTGSKQMLGVDLVGNGEVTIQVAYREDDDTTFIDQPGFATSDNVTTGYTILISDTPPGNPIPIPVTAPSLSLILQWTPNQEWLFEAANLFLVDNKGAGFTAP